MSRLKVAFITLLILLISTKLWSHGVVYDVKKEKAVIIKVTYDDGEPMSYAEVKIFSPDNKDIEHQNGRTDKNGYFAFLPDKPGEWKIIVNDGTGHGVVARISVDEEMKVDTIQHGFGRWKKLIVGMLIFFGLAGWELYFRVKRVKSEG